MSWIVCAYFTDDEIYRHHASKLAQSMLAFNLPYKLTMIKSLGSWQANTQYKPTFIKQMLAYNPSNDIVYVDVDATFHRYPALFDVLSDSNFMIGVSVLDHAKYALKHNPPEMLSGTLFLKNTELTMAIVGQWIDACKSSPCSLDQVVLSKVLENKSYYVLPDRYCCIYDYMSKVQNKVIVHHQASRQARVMKYKKERNVRKNPQSIHEAKN